MTKIIFIGCYFFILVFSFYYTRNLRQVNTESLFLSQESTKSYQEFQEKVHENKILVFTIESKEMNFNQAFEPINQKLIKFQEKYESKNIKVINYKNVLPEDKFDNSYQGVMTYYEKYPEIKLKLIKENSYSGLVIIPNNLRSDEIKEAIDFFRNSVNELNGLDVSFAGMPYVNYMLDQYSEEIKLKAFPIMFFVCILLTLFLTKSFLMTGLLFIPSLFSFSFTLMMIKIMIKNLDMISSVVPLLIFVLNLSLNFHLYFHFLEVNSFKRTIKEKWIPLALMVLTTSIGFGSLLISEIIAIKQFSIISFFSIILTTLFSILWFYLTCQFWIKKEKMGSLLNKIKNILTFLTPLRFILGIGLVIITIFIFSVNKIQIVTDATRYFPEDSNIRKEIGIVQKNVIGNPNIEILVEKKDGLEFSFQDYLKFSMIEKDIVNKIGKDTFILSANELVKEANYFYLGEKILPAVLPAYQLLYSKIDYDLKKGYSLSKYYRMTLFGDHIGKETLDNYKNEIEKIFSNYDYIYSLNGLQYQLINSQNELISILIKSFFMSLTIIVLLISIYFKSFKIIGVFLFVNTMPLLLSVTFFNLFDLSINVATIMTFSIALGIIVDSTIHITYNLLNNVSEELYFNACLRPILLSSLILFVSFLSLSINSFLPIRQVGIMLALNIAGGLLFDLYVVPTLIKK